MWSLKAEQNIFKELVEAKNRKNWTNRRQKYFGNIAELQNAISGGTKIIKSAMQPNNECKTVKFRYSRNKDYVEERCHWKKITGSIRILK